jgi:serine/threonine protein kinase
MRLLVGLSGEACIVGGRAVVNAEGSRSDPTPSRRSLGRYQIIAELARGGMGIVYLALVRGPGSFNKLMVLKELRPEFLEDKAVVAMFLEEARLAACLNHPNVVQTTETGSEGDRHYIAMEYLSGQPLHRFVGRAQRQHEPLPLAVQGHVLCECLEGLAYAHAAADYDGRALGIVHRDVSPHNVFIGYDGQVKVLDFGIAKALDSSVETRTGILKGKVAYMAPEQAACAAIDARADLFAVGVMLFEAATGQRFWREPGGDGAVLRALILGHRPAGETEILTTISPAVRNVIAKATSFAREDRCATAGAMLADLRRALESDGVRPASAQEVGRLVQSLFAEDRARLQAAVEETLGSYRETSSDVFPDEEFPSFAPLVDPASMRAIRADAPPISTRMPRSTRSAPEPSRALATVAVSVPIEIAAPQPSGTGRVRGPAIAVSAAAALAIACGVAWRVLDRAPVSASPPVAPAPVAVEPQAAPAAAPTPSSVHVVVRAAPRSARISIDGRAVTDNPWIATLPASGNAHTVRVEADGYTPQDESFTPTGDTTIVVALEPSKTPARWPPAGRAAPPSAAQTGASAIAAPIPLPAPSGHAEPPSPVPVQTPGSVPQRRINSANPYAH